MRRLILASLLVFMAAVSQAVPTVDVSGGGSGVISAALASVDAGGTITLTDSLTYTDTLDINKQVFIVAASGQTPVIQNAGNAAATTQLVFNTSSGGTKIGSLTGGRITIAWQKLASGTLSTAMIRFKQAAGTEVTMENVTVTETGASGTQPIAMIVHDTALANKVTLRYVDLDMNRDGAPWVSANIYAIALATTGNARVACASDYTLDHVRIKNYCSGGIFVAHQNNTINMSYCDVGVLSDKWGTSNRNYAALINQRADSPWTGRIDHSTFYSGYGNYNVLIGANGSSVTLNRSALIGKYSFDYGTAVGNLYLAGTVGTKGAGSCKVTVDHCDVVDVTTVDKNHYAPMVRPTTGMTYTTLDLTVKNSNVVSLRNKAVNFLDTTPDFTWNAASNNNNVKANALGYSLYKANLGYTTGSLDLAMNPGYLDPATGDVRYTNAVLKTADAVGGAIGVDADYASPYAGIDYNPGLLYTAGSNGSITGTLSQSVPVGGSGTEVVAVPSEHYHFTGWSDGVQTTARTDSNVTNSLSVTANFAIDQNAVTYIAGANGTIDGVTSVTRMVNYGANSAAVTAIPDTGYHFVQWDDLNTTNPRIDTNVIAPATYTASFAISSYNYSYAAGVGGTVNGDAVVTGTTNYNTNGPSVTAAPSTGYVFAKWLDNDSTNPTRQDVITADFNTTATFNALTYHTLTYTAGANGTITGELSQSVGQGFNGTEVVAVPNTGYHFVDWSDGVLTAARTETNVTADISVTANFAINAYTLTYTAGTNGSITGTTPQSVNHGANGTEVVAVPDSGYRFVSWSDGVLTAARTDLNVTGNISVTATFASNTCTLTYTAGTNGSITGTTPQTVTYGGNGTEVVAVPNSGYHFVQWSDGVLTAARTETNVTGDISVTATFAADVVTSIKVPTDYGTIQAAIDAAEAGGTVEIVNSATYNENIRINKLINLIATAGQTPMIQSASGTTTPTLLFDTNSGGTKFGSLTGGRIRVNYVKDLSSTAVVPTGMVKFQQSTGTLVTVENVLIDESGPASGDGIPITNIIHEKDIKNSVNLSYVDIITSRTQTATVSASACGIVIGIGSYTGSSYSPYVTSQGGPTYNLDHVRIKHYTIVGLMPTITSTTLNMSYCDIGVLGDYGRYVTDAGRPWGSINQNGVCAASLFSNVDHSVLRGSRAGHNVNLSGAGSSISLTRSVLINDYYINSGPHANLYFFGGLTAYSPGLPCKVVADHCDIVCKSTGATIGTTTYPQVKKNYWAILRTTNTTTQAQNIYPDCTIKNSNIYSDYNNLIQFQMVHPTDRFVTQNCNVYTGGTDKPSIGYTPGTGDLSMDPLYEDYGSVDLRYRNNTLKTADDQGKPIGVNAGYGDVVAGIVPGTEGVVNRAHGWTLMK